ncbi:hypothetical protein D3C76_1808300 [compost metagenome]
MFTAIEQGGDLTHCMSGGQQTGNLQLLGRKVFLNAHHVLAYGALLKQQALN